MGTVFEIILAGDDADYLRDAGNQALDEVERLEERLSHYRRDSVISDLNLRAPHGPVLLEGSVFRLLQRALALSDETGGAFDPTAGALIRCWGFFRGEGRMPKPEEVAEAREKVGRKLLQLDAEERTARFLREGVQVHLGAIGKGYAVDAAVETLRELRVDAALVHGGTSTVYALGAPPDQDAWLVGLCNPSDREERLGVVPLRDRALSTSGDYEQFFEVDGRRYSHILDPRSGVPAAGVRSATVLAENAADTDALSTGVFVNGLAGARQLHETRPELGLILVPDPEAGGDLQVVTLGRVELRPEEEIG